MICLNINSQIPLSTLESELMCVCYVYGHMHTCMHLLMLDSCVCRLQAKVGRSSSIVVGFCFGGFFSTVLRDSILQNLAVLSRLTDDQASWDLPFPATVLYAGITGKMVAFGFSHGCQASELRSSCLDSRHCTR